RVRGRRRVLAGTDRALALGSGLLDGQRRQRGHAPAQRRWRAEMNSQWQPGRLNSDLDGAGFDTLAVRAGQPRGPEGEHGEALFLTPMSVFRCEAASAVCL